MVRDGHLVDSAEANDLEMRNTKAVSCNKTSIMSILKIVGLLYRWSVHGGHALMDSADRSKPQ